jgi:uncharacterized protein involved in outer membrane biogenesis
LSQKTRPLRKLVIGLSAAIAVVIIAVLAAPFLVPTSFIAGQIAQLVSQKTGRNLQITGPISFTLLPQVTLTAHDVTLASPLGGFSEDFLTAKIVDVELKRDALLHGAIEIDRLRLSQPTVNFEVDKNGERNWIFHLPRSAATTPAVSRSRVATFAAGDVTIVDGAASYLDDRVGRKLRLDAVNMTVSLPSLDGSLNAAGTAALNNEPVNLALRLASLGELRDGRASAATLDITAARGSFAFQGTIDSAEPFAATGTANLKTSSLHDLLVWAKVGLAPEDNTLGPLSIGGKINLGGDKVTLDDATLALDVVTAKGTLVLTRMDGKLELDLNDMAVAGGKGTGKIVIDDSKPEPSIAASAKLTGITVNNVSLNIAGFETLSGTGDVAFDLTGTGKTTRELVASLNGSGRIAFANGRVGSAGLGPLMRNSLGPAVNDKTIPREIAYRSLTASATITQGVLRNTDLKLSGPQLSATGAGTLELAPRRINYLWQPDIAGLGSARVAITGDWETPEYKVESVTITKGVALPGLKP